VTRKDANRFFCALDHVDAAQRAQTLNFHHRYAGTLQFLTLMQERLAKLLHGRGERPSTNHLQPA
jgi:hypothetical protein